MIRNAWRISRGEGQAANPANLRVLVTHPDGRQTVEEIKKPLGLKAGDANAIKERLKRQGLNVVEVEVKGETETTKEKNNKSTAKPVGRGDAATRVQAVFRGHQAQRLAENTRRKVARAEQEKQEAQAFAAEGTQRVRRPQLRSFYGF